MGSGFGLGTAKFYGATTMGSVLKRALWVLVIVMLASLLLDACTTETTSDDIDFSHGVRLTVVHTSDIHSRLLPYDMDVMRTDERMGLLQANGPFGGVSRMGTIIRRIRGQAQHSIHVDSGDLFQGAPIFNEFHGEPEVLWFNMIGIDSFVIGNHEFDDGPLNLFDKLSMANFDVLAANYAWRPTEGQEMMPLNRTAKPYNVVNADGVLIGVIGMANFSSMSSVTYGDSGLGITVLENIQVVQSYVDLLKKDVNIVSVITHLGLGEDEDVVRRTSDVDMIFGGHLHIVLNPPKIIPDNTKTAEGVPAPRMVTLAHSGAFSKYVGHYEGIFYPKPGEPSNLELVSHYYEPIPIDNFIPEDPQISHLLAPYEQELSRRVDQRMIIGYAPQTLRRFGSGGRDSPLGNFLSDAMMSRHRVEADFGATNSLGIRTDIIRGPITVDQMYNVFPFPNAIATMTMSGAEVQTLFDYNTYRSMNRGCQSQLQVAGIRYTLNCEKARREVDAWLEDGCLFEFQYRNPDLHFAENLEIVREGCEGYQGDDISADISEQCENSQYSIASEVPCESDNDCQAFIDEMIAAGKKDRGGLLPTCSEFGFKVQSDRNRCMSKSQGSDETKIEKRCRRRVSYCKPILDTEHGERYRCVEAVQKEWYYKFATNDYMAHGGSGFSSLKYNTTQKNTGVQLREVAIDAIGGLPSCVETCQKQMEAAGLTFDEERLGQCIQVRNCYNEVKAMELRWCKPEAKLSEQEVCLDKLGGAAASCVMRSKETLKHKCFTEKYAKCKELYYTDKIEECYAEQEAENGSCAEVEDVTPYAKCAESFEECKGLDSVSGFERCEALVDERAKDQCAFLPCMNAGTDGRQQQIRPRNLEWGITSYFSNGSQIMKALQETGYDACY